MKPARGTVINWMTRVTQSVGQGSNMMSLNRVCLLTAVLIQKRKTEKKGMYEGHLQLSGRLERVNLFTFFSTSLNTDEHDCSVLYVFD